jgi:PAS domain S-box-containing protein
LRNELTEEQHQRSFQQLLAQGWLVLDVIQHHKDGAPINIWCSMTLIKDEAGHPISILSVNHDVTERKAAERQLLFSASVQANMSDAVIVTDLELRVQSWNKAAELMYGWTAQEAIGKLAGEILQTHYATAADRQQDLDAFFQQGSRQQEVIQQHKTKGAIHVLSSVTLLRDEQGEVVGIVAVNHDITERKQAERKLQQRETWYRTLAQNIPLTSVFLFDREYRYLVVEGPDLAFPAELMEGKRVQEIFPPEVLSHILPGYAAALRGERMTIERVANGRMFEGQFVPIFDVDGMVSNGLLAVRDVTDERAAADTLRKSEERFRHAIIDAPFPIMIHADDGEVLNISNIWTDITGYSHDEIPTIADWTEKAYGERRASVQAIIQTVYGRTEPYKGGELQVRTKSGDIRIWDFNAAALGSLSDGRRIVSTMAIDVTERKQAEEALQKSEARYRALFEQSTDGVFILDLEGNHLQANRHAAEMFGYTLQEMAGFSFREVVAPTEQEQSGRVLDRLLNGERIPPYERRVRRKDGTIFPVEINVELVRTENGQPLHIQSMMRDITERKRSAAELERQRVFLRAVVNSSPNMIFVKDIDGRFIFANLAMANLFDTTIEHLLQQSDDDLNLPEKEIDGFHNADQRVITAGETISVEESLTLKTGEVRWLQTTKVPLASEDGQSIHVLGISTDITERKEAEIALQQALAKEKELGELKTRFVSMASHEFRTPLATILATTETLSVYRHKLTPEKIDQRLAKIKEQISHLQDIMEDVLMLARIQARKVEFNPDKLDIDALCRSILDEFQERTDITHQIRYLVNREIPEVTVDRKLMRQVMSNLLSNAIKYSPAADAVHVCLEYRDSAVRLTVRDEGIGIPEADLNHLFEPFHRAANVGTISGTGLGLVIAKDAVELHGGTITVESKVGVGTTFIVHIPIRSSAESVKTQ